MNCNECEQLILESCDLTPRGACGESAALHLAGCPACRLFLAEQQRLDALLARRLRPSQAPIALQRKVLAEIERMEACKAREAEVRAQLEADYRRRLSAMRHGLQRTCLPLFLDGLSLVVVAAVLLPLFQRQVFSLCKALPAGGPWAPFVFATICGLAFAAHGLLTLRREQRVGLIP